MTTSTSQRRARGEVPLPTVPALEAGDQLTRDEFERRYAAMPGLKKAELIEGVVYIPSPVRVRRHGSPRAKIIGWLGHYQARTPGVEVADNATVRLDLDNEPQPDAMLFIAPELGGQVRISPDDRGVVRSAAFPGLWLAPTALLRGDLAATLQVLDEGLSTPEHAAFAARLAAAGC